MNAITIESAIASAGTGRFQRRLIGVFGLVWAADAMQVLAVGFTAPSIARSFGLSVPQALQTGTVFFLGMLFGAWGFGRLADRFGRRRVLIVTVLLDAVFGLLSGVAPSFSILQLFRFLTGLAVGGTLPVDYAMMAEFLPADRRGRWLVGLEAFWALGTLVLSLVTWALVTAGVEAPWRWVFAINAAPALIGIGLRLWIPESPFHLLRTGRGEEAKTVIDRVALANGRAPAAGTLIARVQGRTSMKALFAGALGRRTLLILVAWLLVSVAYYGVFAWLPSRLVGQGYGFVRGQGFLVLVALAQLPGYALAAWGVEVWGRKPTLIAFLGLSALGCIFYVLAGTPALIASATLTMSFALLGTWGALYAFTPELYPTALRATGMGVAGAVARFGGLLAPSAVGLIVAQSFGTAIAFFAVLLALSLVAVAFLDVETRKQALT
ncbi:MFS transporter, putative metabolite:H+ symporter [Faunimonas pinastri]|uniref:MFS transporter, putative metabolite:H+ symporter n=1 Tax=Faunimonas pinastri TaxID=1855383 RepID=A0A1H9D8E7_9HYPH|nr:MFS transporter [Faunimonas pinastri]SEQ09745.1 MFS transporter, putative metabolite:H+ symporter [Faunimonas pinastri]